MGEAGTTHSGPAESLVKRIPTAWSLAGEQHSAATSAQPRPLTDHATTAVLRGAIKGPARRLPQMRLWVLVRRGGGRHALGSCGVTHETHSHRVESRGGAALSRDKRTIAIYDWAARAPRSHQGPLHGGCRRCVCERLYGGEAVATHSGPAESLTKRPSTAWSLAGGTW